MNVNQAGLLKTEVSGLPWIKRHLRENDIDPLATRDDLPVGVIYPKKVPIRGSVHSSSGKVISRKKINWFFIFPFLYKR